MTTGCKIDNKSSNIQCVLSTLWLNSINVYSSEFPFYKLNAYCYKVTWYVRTLSVPSKPSIKWVFSYDDMCRRRSSPPISTSVGLSEKGIIPHTSLLYFWRGGGTHTLVGYWCPARSFDHRAGKKVAFFKRKSKLILWIHVFCVKFYNY